MDAPSKTDTNWSTAVVYSIDNNHRIIRPTFGCFIHQMVVHLNRASRRIRHGITQIVKKLQDAQVDYSIASIDRHYIYKYIQIERG